LWEFFLIHHFFLSSHQCDLDHPHGYSVNIAIHLNYATGTHYKEYVFYKTNKYSRNISIITFWGYP
jgi:hypothetical protein